MSETEVILMQEAGVKTHDSASPPSIGLRAGAFAEVGTLILTNRRLVYISKGGSSRAAAWAIGGALFVRSVEKSVSKAEIDDLMKYDGSYSIPLQDITHVETARKLGNGYLRVDSNGYGQKPSRSYVFGSGWSKNEDWVNSITSAKAALQYTQVSAPIVAYPPPPPPPGMPICPTCGNTLSYIQQYQRWYCYAEQKYI